MKKINEDALVLACLASEEPEIYQQLVVYIKTGNSISKENLKLVEEMGLDTEKVKELILRIEEESEKEWL